MKQIIIYISAILGLFSGCKPQSNKTTDITTSIPPQKYFIEQLIGTETPINVMITSGNNHANYEPTPKQLQAITTSKIYVKIGELGFENIWLGKILELNPSIIIVSLSDSISPIYGGESCDHDDHHSHEEGIDPHIWTSPKTVKSIIPNLANALTKLYPDKRELIAKNLTQLTLKISSLNKRLDEVTRNAKTKKFIIFHPGYAYLARDYGLEQIAIEKDGKEPSAGYLVELINLAKESSIKTIFIQEEFDKRNGELLAKSIKGEFVIVNPMNENWFEEMNSMIDKLDKALN